MRLVKVKRLVGRGAIGEGGVVGARRTFPIINSPRISPQNVATRLLGDSLTGNIYSLGVTTEAFVAVPVIT